MTPLNLSQKEIYRQFCLKEESLPVFLKDWWLDAVCFEGPWDAVTLYDDESKQVKAVLPYYRVKGRLGHSYLTMPHMTQFMGPWILYPPDQKYTRKLSFEKETLEELIHRLPTFDSFYQNFHYSLTNWLPFYWEGFQQSTGYTYVLENLADLDETSRQFKENIRREIRKAEKEVSVQVENDIEKFYHIACKTYARQELTFPLSMEFMERVDDACERNNCRRILFAVDKQGRVHASVYLVWDSGSVYHLISGGDPKLRTSGATSLLMSEGIRLAAEMKKKFDFEGSMIRPIERFFSSFGAVQKPYSQVSKVNSGYLRLKAFMKEKPTFLKKGGAKNF